MVISPPLKTISEVSDSLLARVLSRKTHSFRANSMSYLLQRKITTIHAQRMRTGLRKRIASRMRIMSKRSSV